MDYCSSYCGLACVDGSCPKIEVCLFDCSECWKYVGCDDCIHLDDCDLPRSLQSFAKEVQYE